MDLNDARKLETGTSYFQRKRDSTNLSFPLGEKKLFMLYACFKIS